MKKIMTMLTVGTILLSSVLMDLKVYADVQNPVEEQVPILAAQKDTPITIPDEILREVINTALHHEADWQTYTPTVAELASIKGRFNLSGRSSGTISTLEGIQYLTGISELISTGIDFPLNEMDKIGSLTQLTYISLNASNIDDLAFVQPLIDTGLLTGMVFYSNQIKDVSSTLKYYNQPNRAQYNFLTQSPHVEMTLPAGSNVQIDPDTLIGMDGNLIKNISVASSDITGVSYDANLNKFIAPNLVGGQTYYINYKFHDSSSSASGAFSGTDEMTIHVLPEVAADVTVSYEDENGTEIHAPQTISGNVGDAYDATTSQYQLTIPGYTLNQSKLPANATGSLDKNPQQVTYIYTKDPVQGADVIVHYQDEQNNELAPDKVLTGIVGDSYQTDELTFDGYEIKTTTGSTTGTFSDKVQEVTYVYRKIVPAPVTVKYEDETGNELATADVLTGKVGLPYQSQAKNIPGYVVKTTPTNASGLFTEQAQEVVYVYERADAAPVTVKYEDETGNELATADVLTGKVGLPYQSQAKSIPGYVVKTTPTNASGLFTEQAQEVVYVYERADAAPVTVKYEDEAGNELSALDVINGKIGLSYQSQPKSITGYVVKTTPTNANGLFTDQAQEVVYIYERTDAAPVTVRYEDESGTELATPDVLNGKVGLAYQTQAKEIAGYTIKTTPDNASGTYTEDAQTVTYIYTKDPIQGADVTVHYQDEAGKELAPDKQLTGKIAERFSTEKLTIEGYKFKTIHGQATGTFTNKSQDVTYIYVKEDNDVSVTPAPKPDSKPNVDKNSESKISENPLDSESTKEQTVFPQTGEHPEMLSLIIGGVLVVGGMLLSRKGIIARLKK